MEHLYESVAEVQRQQLTVVPGRTPSTNWVAQPAPLNRLRGRMDLNFLRQGKDMPRMTEAGRVPDRTGVWFCNSDAGLKAGDRLVMVENDYGQIPVKGIFEIESIPDQAIAYDYAHHIEVQVFEVVQNLKGKVS